MRFFNLTCKLQVKQFFPSHCWTFKWWMKLNSIVIPPETCLWLELIYKCLLENSEEINGIVCTPLHHFSKLNMISTTLTNQSVYFESENEWRQLIGTDIADSRAACSLPLSWSGSPRNKQCVPDKDWVTPRHTVQHQYHGTPPLWPMCHDTQQWKQQYLPGNVYFATKLHQINKPHSLETICSTLHKRLWL